VRVDCSEAPRAESGLHGEGAWQVSVSTGDGMTRFRITGVRTELSASRTHEHISHVRIGAGAILGRQTVVADLRSSSGDRYYTEVSGREAEVVVVACPACDFRDYLRTTADATTANNLLSLPRV
jgi:hypothetical protein